MAKYPIESETRVPPPPNTFKSGGMRRAPPLPPVFANATVVPSPNAKEFEAERLRQKALTKLQYIATAFILFNLLYGPVLYVASAAFARLFWDMPAFLILYALALICALFAISDGKPALLYPVMITTVPFIVIGLAIFFFYLSNAVYCALTRHSQSSLHRFHPMTYSTNVEDVGGKKTLADNGVMKVAVEENFWSCSISPVVVDESHQWTLHPSAILATWLFWVVFVEKLLELIVYRKLFKALQAKKSWDGADVEMDDVIVVNPHPSSSSSVAIRVTNPFDKNAGDAVGDEDVLFDKSKLGKRGADTHRKPPLPVMPDPNGGRTIA